MPTTRINGIGIYWETYGDAGEPVVLVHGSWGDHQNWASVAPGLSQSCRVLTYDRRGHSQSERPATQGSIREDVADLAALVEHHGYSPLHIIGSSFGASIVLRLAAERPGLFRSVIVHEPPLFGLLVDDPDASAALAAAQSRIAAVAAVLATGDRTRGAREFVETIAFGPGAWEALPHAVRETFIFNAPTWLDEVQDPEAMEFDLGRLRSFAAPALLTMGDQSPPFFPRVVGRVAGILPHAETHTYAGAGHVPHLSHPEEYLRVVTTFIAGTARAATTA
jgi:pimeloyl-ACP methyl ester carboxylesterase